MIVPGILRWVWWLDCAGSVSRPLIRLRNGREGLKRDLINVSETERELTG